MVELALLDEPGLEVSGFELTLGRPAYTVETLEHFRRELPDAELHLLIGGDSFADLHSLGALPGDPRAGAAGGADPSGVGAGCGCRSPRADRAGRVRPRRPVSAPTAGRRLLDAPAGAALRRPPPPRGGVPNLVVRYLQKYALYR